MKLLKWLFGGLLEEAAIALVFIGGLGLVYYFAAPSRLGSWAWAIVLAACGAILLGFFVYVVRRWVRRAPPGQGPRP